MVRRFDAHSFIHYRNPDFWDAWAQIWLDSISKENRGRLELWRPKYMVTWEAIDRKNIGFGVKEVCRCKLCHC